MVFCPSPSNQNRQHGSSLRTIQTTMKSLPFSIADPIADRPSLSRRIHQTMSLLLGGDNDDGGLLGDQNSLDPLLLEGTTTPPSHIVFGLSTRKWMARRGLSQGHCNKNDGGRFRLLLSMALLKRYSSTRRILGGFIFTSLDGCLFSRSPFPTRDCVDGSTDYIPNHGKHTPANT
jgi:hypothetical protein